MTPEDKQKQLHLSLDDKIKQSKHAGMVTNTAKVKYQNVGNIL